MLNLSNAISVERSRIDNLLTNETLDENSELIDIRVGYDGETYESAGTAVRTQVSELKGDIVNLSDSLEVSYIETATDVFEFDDGALPNDYWAMSKVYKKGFINKIIVECASSHDNSSILIANANNHHKYNQYTFNAIGGVNEIAINKYIEYDFYVFVLAPTKFTQKIGKYKSCTYTTTLSFIYDNQFAISVDRKGVYGELDRIRDDMVLGNDDNNGSYVIKDNTKNIVVVDCLGNGDFTNIKSACESITNSNINNQYEIVVRPGTYNENYIIVPNFTHIHGIKPNTIVVTSEGISGTNAVFDQRYCSSKLSNMHIKSQTGYCIHYDVALDRKVIKNENLILELLPNRQATNNSIIAGGSFLYGTYVEWKNCTFINGTVSCHTNQFKYDESTLEMCLQIVNLLIHILQSEMLVDMEIVYLKSITV